MTPLSMSPPGREADRLLQRIEKLTSADLRAVAKKYLSGDNYVVASVKGAVAPAAKP